MRQIMKKLIIKLKEASLNDYYYIQSRYEPVSLNF